MMTRGSDRATNDEEKSAGVLFVEQNPTIDPRVLTDKHSRLEYGLEILSDELAETD
jgi:hypothetical protein